MDPILRVSSAAEPAAEKIIGEGLSAFNDATVGYADRVPLQFSSAIQAVERSSAG
jgi:hypothetical protein